ncbi:MULTISPECIES: SDR family oxidoreductase [unclassified Saccharopolyspora]|uniref:SDR family oxidoreductase n=1 Tax=unclassified Saccharopolyspora TaxID=2646250 RepID=UPI001CD3E3EC|nr:MULTISPECIES: SDR family oxidoreductase [unclassified Saccharopolyspora]MCA1189307.1 SDR family oxidoreductase [Saccharopolyspora sp. 6T]MCA1195303.1 SDR family oxidoreductase [Saccharopolyspora sp. 6V]MCA1229129.1 SDR family oxidoreductase [Saccharopolyspora sp. 6M]MCA1283005.1 SDR family oxidoreductase [Saccharopolyspora sp. 7B]
MTMLVTVLGATGKTGSLIVAELLARGVPVRGAVRRPEAADELRARGAEAVLADLRSDTGALAAALAGSDVVINAAAASDPQPGLAEAVDRDGAINAVKAAEKAGADRFVQVSSLFADRPDEGPEFLHRVLRAKQASDLALAESALAWTIVRPGGLTDDPGAGLVRIADRLTIAPGIPRTIPRADVAAVTAAVLDEPSSRCRGFDLTSGTTAIADAIAA